MKTLRQQQQQGRPTRRQGQGYPLGFYVGLSSSNVQNDTQRVVLLIQHSQKALLEVVLVHEDVAAATATRETNATAGTRIPLFPLYLQCVLITRPSDSIPNGQKRLPGDIGSA